DAPRVEAAEPEPRDAGVTVGVQAEPEVSRGPALEDAQRTGAKLRGHPAEELHPLACRDEHPLLDLVVGVTRGRDVVRKYIARAPVVRAVVSQEAGEQLVVAHLLLLDEEATGVEHDLDAPGVVHVACMLQAPRVGEERGDDAALEGAVGIALSLPE